MGSIILIGSKTEHEKIINDYIKKYSVANYNILRFADKITILNAREIKHLLSRSAGGTRIILFHDNMTVEAQNALLKTLEDLPEDTFVFFAVSSSDKLIPTIVSRSQIMRMPVQVNDSEDFAYGKDIEEFIEEDDIGKKIAIGINVSEKISSANKIDELIIFLKKGLHENAGESTVKNFKERITLLRILLKNYDLVTSNNINKRLFLENVFISATNPNYVKIPS